MVIKMSKQKYNTRWLAGVSIFSVIIITLANTPIGMIPLPLIKATTTHIPVILGAIFLGPLAGAVLGGVFGLCSMIISTITPTLLSFAFSPFYSFNIIGAIKAIWIAVICRIMIGIVAGWLWILLKNLNLNYLIALPIVGFIGSMTNTILVMGSIYFLLGMECAKVMDSNIESVFKMVIGIIGTSGVLEAIVTLVLVTMIGKVLLTVYKQ